MREDTRAKDAGHRRPGTTHPASIAQMPQALRPPRNTAMARTRTGIPLRARAITIELSPARPVGLGSPGEPSQGPATTSCVLGSVDLLERAVLVDEDHDELDESPDAVRKNDQVTN